MHVLLQYDYFHCFTVNFINLFFISAYRNVTVVLNRFAEYKEQIDVMEENTLSLSFSISVTLSLSVSFFVSMFLSLNFSLCLSVSPRLWLGR